MKLRLFRAILRFALLLFVLGVSAIGLLVAAGLQDHIATADAALVLGNTVHPDGTPSARLTARLGRALELYREGRFPLIIVSGGFGKEGHDEAVVMGNYLVHRGVPPEKVIVDSTGVTTYASARATRDILKQRNLRSVLVVSQYFHVPRSMMALRKFGVEPVYGSHARYFEWRDVFSVPRELIGYLSYAVRDYPINPEPE